MVAQPRREQAPESAASLREGGTKKCWRKVWSFVKEGLSIFLPAAGLLISAVLIVAIVVDWRQNDVILRPVQVPKSLVDLGYSPEVVSQRLMDAYNDFELQAASERKGQRIDWPAVQQDLQLPGLGLSVHSLELMLRWLVGDEPRVIEGEIAEVDGQLDLRLRLNAKVITNIDLPDGKYLPIDRLIRSAAEEIVRNVDPYALAEYYYDRYNNKKALELINECVALDNKADLPWAYNLWGLVYWDEQKYEQAEGKFEAAIALDPSFGIAYENLADVDDDWPGNPDGTDFAKETIGKGWKLFGATGVRLGAHGIIEQMPEDALNERIVGFFYYNGYFVNPDKRLAADWYRKAAEQGNLVAEYEFGLSLEDGDTDIPKGDPRASEEAAKWYRKAAEQSSPDAEVALGNMYRDGNGVDQDAEAAVQWYLKSAEQDDTDGQVSLGDMYLGGQGVGYDPREALNWYSQAADLGNPAAETAIGDFYRNGRGVPRNFSLARKWYLKAAASENADAHYNLGLMSDLGQGTRRNREDALLQYQDAARAYAYDADGGDGHAEARLGTMAATGQGVSQSEVVAYVWYARAYYDLKPGPERDRVLQMMSVLKLKAVAWLAEPRLVNGLIQSAIALQQMVVQPP